MVNLHIKNRVKIVCLNLNSSEYSNSLLLIFPFVTNYFHDFQTCCLKGSIANYKSITLIKNYTLKSR